ncbi:GMC oxidoreductase [Streptomyces massasporeus]|uniref:GMC oxidoreductase n=1 Tax=Streptomyces massasporeus TaxID=67324 RepID=UPI0036B0DCAB
MRNILIVGGGLSGLEFALALQRHGECEITILEWGCDERVLHEKDDSSHHADDRRIRPWRSLGSGWGPGTGLKRRLGGRSLCWHGVVLPIESYALARWPPVWQQLLTKEGLYQLVTRRLRQQYPAVSPGEVTAAAYGLAAVPQAVSTLPRERVDETATRHSVYSPLHALDLSRVTLIMGARVNRVRRSSGAVLVDYTTSAGLQSQKADLCVLACGAIENARIYADSIGETFETKVTDHFCVGAVSRLSGAGAGLGEGQLIGYTQWADLRSNVFVQEQVSLSPTGARAIVDAWALVEQDREHGSLVQISPAASAGAFGSVTIQANISPEDRRRLLSVSRGLHDFTNRYPGADVAVGNLELQQEPAALEEVVTGVSDRAHYYIPLGAVDHEAGTLPMGETVGENLELTHMRGVYVLGASVFPASGAANPSLTVLCLSNWLARHVSEM